VGAVLMWGEIQGNADNK